MDPTLESLPTAAPLPPRLGLAVASLVLGIVAVCLSLFLIGAVFGLIGLALGWVHIAQKRGPCVRERPHLIKLQNETTRDELVVVGISKEDEMTLKTFVKTKGVNYPIASATDLPSPYKDVQAVPTTFFIDRKGVIQSVVVG